MNIEIHDFLFIEAMMALMLTITAMATTFVQRNRNFDKRKTSVDNERQAFNLTTMSIVLASSAFLSWSYTSKSESKKG